jgi:beta-galactosidase
MRMQRKRFEFLLLLQIERESRMKSILSWIFVGVFCLSGTALAYDRQRLLLDFNWRFNLGDATDAGNTLDYPEIRDLAKAHLDDASRESALATRRVNAAATNLGANLSFVQNNFDDSAWKSIDLPHDWVVELPFDRRGDESHGFKQIGPRLGNTIGWYRRKFDLPADDQGHALWIEFDGVYRDSLVWLNGHCLGRNVSGYSSFWYDISKFANFGGSNELVVRVDATRTEGWFYEGAGIYRHVWLVKTDPLHVAHWGTYVVSDLEGENAAVKARTTVRNDSDAPADFVVVSTVVDAVGNMVVDSATKAHLDAGQESEVPQGVTIFNAHRWSLDNPYLYKLITTILRDGQVADKYETTFGARSIRFDVDQGFFLNGKHVEIQGTCNHQDHAGVGSALPDRLQYFRIEKLKEMGANAYRTSHNDPTPELLDACDQLGMLVMDEHRQVGTTPEVLSQLKRLVMRDRNHPSVFIWSIGNEEGAVHGTPAGVPIATTMQSLVHQLDPTRPCTDAMNGAWGRGFSTVIDVQGFNYLTAGNMDAFHRQFPNKPSIATEEASTLSTRGVYANDRVHGYVSAYDVNAPRWGSTAERWWRYYLDRPYVAGAFVWTGFDYRGEPTPYSWPCISSQFGIMDTCGFPKDNYYYYQAWWSGKPVLHLLPHWNWPGHEGSPIHVWCYSNLDAVELFLNGQSQGKQTVPVNSHLEWAVPYAPGTLEARGYKGDLVVATTQIQTAGPAAKLVLTPDRGQINADGTDVSVVDVSVVDAQGRTVPLAGDLVKFAISGPGRVIGVGNGEPSSHDADKAMERHAFRGLCMALVQSDKTSGPIQLTATADGLESATATISAEPCTLPPQAP